MEYPQQNDADDEDDDDDDSVAVEEDDVQVQKIFVYYFCPGGVIISVPRPKRGVPFAAHILSRFT